MQRYDGITGRHSYQKRAVRTRPPWIEVAELRGPSGRPAEEIVTLARNRTLRMWSIHSVKAP
jgi:DNA primase